MDNMLIFNGQTQTFDWINNYDRYIYVSGSSQTSFSSRYQLICTPLPLTNSVKFSYTVQAKSNKTRTKKDGEDNNAYTAAIVHCMGRNNEYHNLIIENSNDCYNYTENTSKFRELNNYMANTSGNNYDTDTYQLIRLGSKTTITTSWTTIAKFSYEIRCDEVGSLLPVLSDYRGNPAPWLSPFFMVGSYQISTTGPYIARFPYTTTGWSMCKDIHLITGSGSYAIMFPKGQQYYSIGSNGQLSNLIQSLQFPNTATETINCPIYYSNYHKDRLYKIILKCNNWQQTIIIKNQNSDISDQTIREIFAHDTISEIYTCAYDENSYGDVVQYVQLQLSLWAKALPYSLTGTVQVLLSSYAYYTYTYDDLLQKYGTQYYSYSTYIDSNLNLFTTVFGCNYDVVNFNVSGKAYFTNGNSGIYLTGSYYVSQAAPVDQFNDIVYTASTHNPSNTWDRTFGRTASDSTSLIMNAVVRLFTDSQTFELRLPDLTPQATIAIDTINGYGAYKDYIQNISYIKLTPTITAGLGSYVKSIAIQGPENYSYTKMYDETKTTLSDSFEAPSCTKSGDASYVVRVTDSRNITMTYNSSNNSQLLIPVMAYSPPSVKIISLERNSENENIIEMNYSIICSSVNSHNSLSSMEVKYRDSSNGIGDDYELFYKKTFDDSEGNILVYSTDLTAPTITSSNIGIITFDSNKQYDFIIIATDDVSEYFDNTNLKGYSDKAHLTTASRIFNILENGNGFAIGRLATNRGDSDNQGLFEVGWDTVLDKGLQVGDDAVFYQNVAVNGNIEMSSYTFKVGGTDMLPSDNSPTVNDCCVVRIGAPSSKHFYLVLDTGGSLWTGYQSEPDTNVSWHAL